MAHRKSSNPNRWSKSFKKRLLSEVAEPGSSFERIARLYGLKVNQLLAWQKRYGGTPVATSPAFFPIKVLSDEENGFENLASDGFEARSTAYKRGRQVEYFTRLNVKLELAVRVAG